MLLNMQYGCDPMSKQCADQPKIRMKMTAMIALSGVSGITSSVTVAADSAGCANAFDPTMWRMRPRDISLASVSRLFPHESRRQFDPTAPPLTIATESDTNQTHQTVDWCS